MRGTLDLLQQETQAVDDFTPARVTPMSGTASCSTLCSSANENVSVPTSTPGTDL